MARVDIFVVESPMLTLFSYKLLPSMMRLTTECGKSCQREVVEISHTRKRFAASWLYCKMTPCASVSSIGWLHSSIDASRFASRLTGLAPPSRESSRLPIMFASSVMAFR